MQRVYGGQPWRDTHEMPRGDAHALTSGRSGVRGTLWQCNARGVYPDSRVLSPEMHIQVWFDCVFRRGADGTRFEEQVG